MASTRFWALWFVFNIFFLSWLFDWVKLAKDWASREKLKRQEVRSSALTAALLKTRPAVVRRRNVSLPKEGPFGPFWAMHRLRTGGSVRIVAGGLSRSGSTWQFNALRILMQHAAKSAGLPESSVSSAHGHSIDDLQPCLKERVCVVKVHEFLPRVLVQADAVFVTHRDPRDVLLSSAQKIEACLLAGKQPLESAFRSYAAWVPHACHDMRYEQMAAGGAAQELHAMAVKLGVGGVVNLLDVAAQLGQITHRADPNVQQQQQTGLMPGHLTHLTTDPGAHLVFEDAVARGAFSKKCNLTREIELINAGFGKWLAKEGYPLPPRTAQVPRALPPSPPPPHHGGLEYVPLPRAAQADDSAMLAELQTEYMLQHRLAWRNEELSNWYVDSLPEAAWLMWRPHDGSEPPTSPHGVVQQCPLRSSWSTMLDRSGVWQYSVPGGKGKLGGNPPQRQPANAQQQAQQQKGGGGGSYDSSYDASYDPSNDAKAVAAAAAAKQADEKRAREAREEEDAAEFDKQGRPRLVPTFMLMGSPRSGTTVLYDSLTSNDPNIVPATTKEVNYFNSAGYESKPAKWYFSQFKRKKLPGQITGDGSCTSVLCPKVAARVRERAPCITRLLMCVRDEVRRVQSHYRMCKQNERVEIEGKPDGKRATRPPNKSIKPLPPLAELIAAELRHIRQCDAKLPNATVGVRFSSCYISAEATCKFSSALLPDTLHTSNRPGCQTLLAASMYAAQLKPWLDTFGAEQLLIVQKRDLAERPRITLENVSDFLGSPHKYSKDREVKGGATQKPKHRDFAGNAQLPEKLKVELEEFFRPHREAFAQLLKVRKIKMTRLTDESKKTYLV